MTNLFRERTTYLLWLALCVLAAFWLRTYRLDLQSFWYDEGVTVDIARRTLPDLTRWTAQDIQPPLYYYVVSVWGKGLQTLAFGAPGAADLASLEATKQSVPFLWGGAWSEWSIRFLSVFFGTLTVPLLAALAIRLSGQRQAGAIAALLTAAHPLLFYYSQEARMYAMLTFLGVLAGYILFTPRGTSNTEGDSAAASNPRWWLYITVATAAVYTHYFAFFLLAALGLGYLLQPAAGDKGLNVRQRLSSLVSAHVTILILYIPWFVALFTQLRRDSSYWQGEFKLTEAIQKVAISFVGGETVTETMGLWLLVPIGIVTLVTLFALLWPSRQQSTGDNRLPASPGLNGVQGSHSLITYILWWLLPTILILLLAIFLPKFNSRYVMLGLPGLILLWSAGLSRMLGAGSSSAKPSPAKTRAAPEVHHSAVDESSDHTVPPLTSAPSSTYLSALAAVLLAAMLATFFYADRNYFTDPEFTKTQWRPLAQYVRKRIPPQEAVVLTSGHTWPIWNYYAPNVDAVSVPRLRILDVNSVLDYPTTASLLANELAGRQGAWLVSWQDEVVDPMDVVPLYLERAGNEVPSERDYWDISLRRFEALDVSRFQASVGSPVGINYGNQLVLHGFETHSTGELLLYWQRHPGYQPPTGLQDYRLTGQLRTVDGLVYANFDDQALTLEEWPTARWSPEQLVVSRIPATVWAGFGAMPGDYGLQLGLYDPAGDLGGYDIVGADGQLMGKMRTLPVQLISPSEGSVAEPDSGYLELGPNLYADVRVGALALNGINSTNANTDSTDVVKTNAVTIEAGQSLPLAIDWLLTDALAPGINADDVKLNVRWLAASSSASQKDEPPRTTIDVSPGFALAEWPVGQRLRTLHLLPSDSALSAGSYDLTVALDGSPESQILAAKGIDIQPSSRSFDLPPIVRPLDVEFGRELVLRGLQAPVILPENATQDEQIALELVWQAIDTPAQSYSISVQLLDEAGRPVSQADLQLPGGSESWIPQQVETQTVELTIPAGFATGQIIAVVYDADTVGFPRLLRPNGTDFVILAESTP